MSKLRFNITMSLDGYVAGPNQSLKDPLGVGGEALHDWAVELAAFKEVHGQTGGVVNASSAIMQEMFENVGAVIIGTTFRFVTDGIESALSQARQAFGSAARADASRRGAGCRSPEVSRHALT